MKFIVVIAISLLVLLLQTQLADATGVGFDKKAYTWTSLVETGTHTGIFAGSVTLTGDPSLKGAKGVDGQGMNPSGLQSGNGPNDGFLPSENSDGVTASLLYNKDQTITGSALVQWNFGQMQWLQQNYQINEQGKLQIIDQDMNLNPKAIDILQLNHTLQEGYFM